MTSFNSASVLMDLDEYYEQCVVPKPCIPKPYTSNEHKSKNRKAGRLQSYKDFDFSDGEEDGEDDVIKPSKLDSNDIQLNYEMNQFNLLYESENQSNFSNNQVNNDDPSPFESAQWRNEPNNVNRPLDASPLVPKNLSRNNTKSYFHGNRGEQYQNNRIERGRPLKCNNGNNSNNNKRGYPQQFGESRQRPSNGYNFKREQQQNQQFGQQHLRNAFNMFINDGNQHGNQFTPQQNTFNFRNQVRNDDRFNAPAKEIGIRYNDDTIRSNSWISSNSFTNLNTAKSAVSPPATRLRTDAPMAPISFRDEQVPPPETRLMTNAQMSLTSFRNEQPMNVCANIVPVHDSLRLADLLNIDSCKNINAYDVAKNAIFLLNTLMNKQMDTNAQMSCLQQGNRCVSNRNDHQRNMNAYQTLGISPSSTTFNKDS